jgi:DNA mismatch repair ATPase MutS
VLEHEATLLTLGFRLAEADVLCSFAEVSQVINVALNHIHGLIHDQSTAPLLNVQDYNYVRPSMVADNVLFVKGARHPLQELTVPTFIPNDIAVSIFPMIAYLFYFFVHLACFVRLFH